MKISFDKITEFDSPCLAEGEDRNIPEENRHAAEAVLRNWCAAASWGLPGAIVADILDAASRRLRGRDDV